MIVNHCCFFFFQAEDGIRDLTVTGVQTCALPISDRAELQPPDVGAEVQLGRHEPVAAAVAWQEDDTAALELAGAELVGGIAERRAHPPPADRRPPPQLGEPTASHDAQPRAAHPLRPPPGSP